MKSNFFKSLKKTCASKKFWTVAAVFALCVIPTFAASGGDSIVELDNWADKILELFQSSWVKAILLVALIVEAIGMVLAGQQGGGGQMIKKFAPWISIRNGVRQSIRRKGCRVHRSQHERYQCL